MMTRREYAVSKGLAKPGRGRMTKAAHDEINRAVKEDGMQFSDMPGVGNPDAKPVKSEDVSKVDKDKPDNYFGPTPDKIYNGGWYVIDSGKKVTISGKEVCRTCSISLDWHRCDAPTFPSTRGSMIRVMR